MGDHTNQDDSRHRPLDRFRHVCIWRGVIMPIIPLSIGVEAVLTQSTVLAGAGRSYESINVDLLQLHGLAATARGIGWLGAALMLHSRYFWGRVEPIWRHADFGLITGLIALTGGWGYAVFWAITHVIP